MKESNPKIAFSLSHLFSKWETWFWIALLALAATLRLWGLNFQSLSMKELRFITQADPGVSLRDLFAVIKADFPNSPFYNLGLHAWFNLFSYNDFYGRAFSVIAGLASIPFIYWIARELHSKRVGLMAAFLTTINYYHLFYSQEVSNAIFAFAASCICLFGFIKLIKQPSVMHALVYFLTAVLLFLTHYNGIAIIVAQLLSLPFFFKDSRQEFRTTTWYASFAFLLVATTMVSWLLLPVKSISNRIYFGFKPEEHLFSDFLPDHPWAPGNLIMYLAAALIIAYLYRTITSQMANRSSNSNTQTPDPVFCVAILLFPVIIGRYSIVLLPHLLLLLALAIGTNFKSFPQYLVLALLVFLTITDFSDWKKYYWQKHKTQWREAVEFAINNDPGNTVILSSQSQYLQYYLDYYRKRYNYTIPATRQLSDSLLTKKGIWMIANDRLDSAASTKSSPFVLVKNISQQETLAKWLDSTFIRDKEVNLNGCLARLYIRGDGFVIRDFTGNPQKREGYVVMWGNGTLQAAPVRLKKGRYRLRVNGYSSDTRTTAHLNIYLNKILVDNFWLKKQVERREVDFFLLEDTETSIALEFDNDHAKLKDEDINAFIRDVEVLGPLSNK